MQHERQSLRGCAKRPKIEAAFWWRNLCSPVPALLLLHEFRLAEDQNVTGSHRVTTGAALTDQKSWNLAICFGEDPGCPKCLRTGITEFFYFVSSFDSSVQLVRPARAHKWSGRSRVASQVISFVDALCPSDEHSKAGPSHTCASTLESRSKRGPSNPDTHGRPLLQKLHCWNALLANFVLCSIYSYRC
jgi:hypothetical protein